MGKISIDAPIRMAMIGFGQRYEIFTTSSGIAEISIEGTVIFKGFVQFGPDYFIYVAKGAILEMGNMSSMGRSGKLICTQKVVFGDYSRIGFESQVIDTSFHPMIDLSTNIQSPSSAPIFLGDKNYIGNRVSIMKGAATPGFATIASNSVCNKDLSSLPENSLIAGVPAKFIKTNITRDWEKDDFNTLIIFQE